MKEVFNKIYETNKWQAGSGLGSTVEATFPYTNFLQNFIRQNGIRSVVDSGCGDWQFSKTIDWSSTDYRGFDVVDCVIESNQKYATSNISFHNYCGDPDKLPPAELLVMKDVLQHLSFDLIKRHINNFFKYKYCLITNDINPKEPTVNQDIMVGNYAQLDLRQSPFYLDCAVVLEYSGGGRKQTLLVQ